VSPPGFEDLVEAELRALGLDTHRVAGGVEFTGSWPDVWRANLWCRVASRVLVRVAEFSAETFPSLEKGLAAVTWGEWLPPGAAVDVRAAKHKTRLYHTGKVAEVLSGVLGKALGVGPPGEAERGEGRDGEGSGDNAHRLHVRIDGPRVTVSLDTTGEHLHRRGYRVEAGPAPLRENLAAALLLRARWDGSEPLLDPFCGSGTFPIEAALLALRIPPGRGRAFAFEGLPGFRPKDWNSVRGKAEAGILRVLPAPVFGSDRDPRAVALAARSARRAGLADHVQVAVAELAELEAPAASGLLVANPPYGVRLGGEGSALRSLGAALRGSFAGWRWAAVVPEENRRAGRELGLPATERLVFRSGGLRLHWAQGGPASAAEVSE
jgi:putative N6-adenine-specific DNA methylase